MPEILTVSELSVLSRRSRSQIYKLCRTRVRDGIAHRMPMLKINGNLKFNKTAVTESLSHLQQEAP